MRLSRISFTITGTRGLKGNVIPFCNVTMRP
jgi:hypothetical protein